MTTPERVQKAIADVCMTDPADVQPNTSLVEDLALDSLDLVEMVMALEEEFGREIPDEAQEGWKTVADVIDYIERG